MENSRNHPIDCGIATTPQFSRQFAKQTISNRSADIEYVEERRITVPQNESSVQYGDLNVLRYGSSVAVTDFKMSVTTRQNKIASVKSITSSNNGILLPQDVSSLFCSHVQDGECVVTIELENGEKYPKLLAATTQTIDQLDIFQSFANGSLIKHIYDSTAALADDSTQPLLHYAYYAGQPYVTNNFLRSNGCWLKDFDLSGVSIKTGSGSTRMCSMISPSFAAGIVHGGFHPQIGESVSFCNQSGEIVSRTVENVYPIPYRFSVLDQEFTQIRDNILIKFTQPVSEGIKKYKLFPANINNYLPINQSIYDYNNSILVDSQMTYCPTIAISHYRWDNNYPQPSGAARNNRYVYLHYVYNGRLVYSSTGSTIDIDQPSGFAKHYPDLNFPNYNGIESWIRGGDSGGPNFCIINNDLIFLGPHSSATSFDFWATFAPQIQDIMNEMGSNGETLQYANLSGFTDFSS
jgi:hypothetical protein